MYLVSYLWDDRTIRFGEKRFLLEINNLANPKQFLYLLWFSECVKSVQNGTRLRGKQKVLAPKKTHERNIIFLTLWQLLLLTSHSWILPHDIFDRNHPQPLFFF